MNIVLWKITELLILILHYVETERPKYREDYQYEKTFSAFYKVHHTAAEWPVARVFCLAEGAELMVPNTLDEADAMPVLITTVLNKFRGVFIGMHDLYAERTFVTTKGKRIQDTILSLLWEKFEPKPAAGRCIAMRRSGRFFVHPCSEALPFICKINENETTYNKECNSFDPRWKLGHNGSCYIVHTDPQTWYQAYGTCLGAGGHLAVINSKAEAKHIQEKFKEAANRRIPNNNFAFLGYSDLFQRHHFKTIFGEKIEDVGYREWDVKCPQNVNTSSQDRCGGILRNGLLTNGDCSTPAMFFCEKSVNTTSIAETALRNREAISQDVLYADFI